MKITIINIDNWGYNRFIKLELEKKGIIVTFIDLEDIQYKYPSFASKIFNFLSKNLFNYNLKREHLHKSLIKKIVRLEKQDQILVIKGDFLSKNSIKYLKDKTSNLKIFFNDSFNRYPRMKKIHSYFDEVYSFDPDDVNKYGFKFISNYIYSDINKVKKNTKSLYQVFNISSLDKRNKTLPQIATFLKKNHISYKIIAFSNKPFSNNLNIEVINTSYSLEEVFNMIKKTDVILDLQRPKQKGLSFRVFEAIGLEKKLISTNKDLVNYDFYNPNNMIIIDSDAIVIPEDFFKSPYKKIDPKIVTKYHISSWVSQVFNLDN